MKLSKQVRRSKSRARFRFYNDGRGMCYSPMLTTSSQIRTSIVSVSLNLAAKLRLGTGNQDYLKDVLRSLRFCEVEWNLLNKDNKQVWGIAGLLASVEIEDGICSYEFPKPLRLKLYNPRVYAKLNLHLQNQFKSRSCVGFMGGLFRLF